MPIRNPDGLGELYLLQPNGYRVRLGNVISAQTVISDFSFIDGDSLEKDAWIFTQKEDHKAEEKERSKSCPK